jgi:hypothetical protein
MQHRLLPVLVLLEHFCDAASDATIQITLPSCKGLATAVLDSMLKEVQLGTAEKLAGNKFIDASSDGLPQGPKKGLNCGVPHTMDR